MVTCKSGISAVGQVPPFASGGFGVLILVLLIVLIFVTALSLQAGSRHSNIRLDCGYPYAARA
jgi:hypothetical protein